MPSSSDRPLAPDGLPTRESHAYALEKLYYAEHYMRIFSVGMKNHWKERVYMDLLAGPGRIRLRGTVEEYPGSPLLSMGAPFTSRIFVEHEPLLADALRRRVSDGGKVLVGDCNSTAVISELRAATDGAGTLGLAFIDNLGLDVPFSTLRALTNARRIDLMVVMQLQELTRNVNDAFNEKQDPGRLTAFFGTPNWVEAVRNARDNNTPPAEIANRLVTLYLNQLATIDYGYAVPGLKVMRNSKNATQYRLVLAGKHERATDFFRKIERIDPYGQRSLL